jgi:hypothetical protein
MMRSRLRFRSRLRLRGAEIPQVMLFFIPADAPSLSLASEIISCKPHVHDPMATRVLAPQYAVNKHASENVLPHFRDAPKFVRFLPTCDSASLSSASFFPFLLFLFPPAVGVAFPLSLLLKDADKGVGA